MLVIQTKKVGQKDKVRQREGKIFTLDTNSHTFLRTELSWLVMARESVGSVRLNSDRYSRSLLSNSGSGGRSSSTSVGVWRVGPGLSLRVGAPSLLPTSEDKKKKRQKEKDLFNNDSLCNIYTVNNIFNSHVLARELILTG